MAALYLVPSPHEAILPPMDEIQYTDPVTGELKGGWWVYGIAPQPEFVLVVIDTDSEEQDVLAERTDIMYLGEVNNG